MAKEGTTDGSALGFQFYDEQDPFGEAEAPEVTDPSEAEVPEDPDAPEEVAAVAEPAEVPEVVEPATDEGEPSGSEEEPAEPGSEEEPPGAPEEPELYADVFPSVEALEKGYKELLAWNTRVAQENAKNTRSLSEVTTRLAEQEKLQAQLVYDVNQRRAAEDPEFAERWAAMQAQQAQIDEQVKTQVGPIQAQLQAEQQAREQMVRRSELLAVVNQFQAQHPDIIPNSPKDFELAQIVRDLSLDPGDPNALELAYAVSEDADLRVVLTANPSWAETQAGLTLAQAQATTLAAARATTATPSVPATPPPHVETGASGAPTVGAPGTRPKDSFDEALEIAAKEKDSIFR